MNFDFSPDQKALRDQARKFLSEQASSTRVRRILDTETPYDAELWRGMAEMGWTGTAIPESYGGAGFGYLELCVLAEELGRSVAPAPFSSTIYLAAEALLLAGSEAQKRRWLPRIAAGEAIGCLALAEGPQAPTPESLTTRARQRPAQWDEGARGRRGRGGLRRRRGARWPGRVAVPRGPARRGREPGAARDGRSHALGGVDHLCEHAG